MLDKNHLKNFFKLVPLNSNHEIKETTDIKNNMQPKQSSKSKLNIQGSFKYYVGNIKIIILIPAGTKFILEINNFNMKCNKS